MKPRGTVLETLASPKRHISIWFQIDWAGCVQVNQVKSSVFESYNNQWETSPELKSVHTVLLMSCP